MENYINNLLFTYLPHIAFAVFWFGLITRIIYANRSIQARSTQLLADNRIRSGSNLFHLGILAVLLGHFTLFIPEKLYHLIMTTETKRLIALCMGSFFGVMTVIGMILLIYRRFFVEKIRRTSNFHDYFIIILLLCEATLGLISVGTTASGTVEHYAALGVWAQKVVTFQPDAGAVLASHSIIYKIHIVTGLIIIMIFPYTKLMHMLVMPVVYFFRTGFQLVRKSIRGIINVFLLIIISCSFTIDGQNENSPMANSDHPKIINIINFVRLLEPRDPAITKEVLYQTVVSQLEIMKEYKLKGTFLLQYDALIDPRYQKLFKDLPGDSIEIGAWWEIPQPLVEKAGLKWRGRYPWDWHADVGFSTGYTPEEREKLIDVYMTDFREIFGYYPRSAGSWFIDIHSLTYMYEKYNIVASCNCKDQSGTDGYTLWGGYWNQAYYPSRINSYMPAQNEENQLKVPVFRMLGSDPVRQYDTGLGKASQGVISLEPVYRGGGGDEKWVNWYFREFVTGSCMEFAYVQAGQENSFTWDAMKEGYEIQMPLIAKLRDQNKVVVNTLAGTGLWFSNRYRVTPATSVTINNDIGDSDLKTVWFNSRFFRMNIIWEDSTLRIRDIHLFDEKFPSFYTTGVAKSNQVSFITLPFVDGYFWSAAGKKAGMRLKAIMNDKEILVKGGNPVITDSVPGVLQIKWPVNTFQGTLVAEIREREIMIRIDGNAGKVKWFLELTTSGNSQLPFREIKKNKILCLSDGMNYSVSALNGYFRKRSDTFIILPEKDKLTLDTGIR